MTASTATHTPNSAKSRGPQPCIGKPIRSAVAHYDKVLAPKFEKRRKASDLRIDAKAKWKEEQLGLKKRVFTLREPPIPEGIVQQHGRGAVQWSWPEFYHRVTVGAFERDALKQLLCDQLSSTGSGISSATDWKGQVTTFTGAMMCGAVIVRETRPGETRYTSHQGIVVNDNVDEYIDAVIEASL